jgi:hypothetical protein
MGAGSGGPSVLSSSPSALTRGRRGTDPRQVGRLKLAIAVAGANRTRARLGASIVFRRWPTLDAFSRTTSLNEHPLLIAVAAVLLLVLLWLYFRYRA